MSGRSEAGTSAGDASRKSPPTSSNIFFSRPQFAISSSSVRATKNTHAVPSGRLGLASDQLIAAIAIPQAESKCKPRRFQ